jgi:hypothetical protein
MSILFQPHPQIHKRVDLIGAERAPVLVIDNFVSDPERLIDQASAAFARGSKPRSYFPGQATPAPEAFALPALGYLLPTICRTFGVSGKIRNGGCDFQVLSRPPDRLDLRQKIPHIDSPDTNILASVHYLCPKAFLGTHFYRHKATGFEIVTQDRLGPYETSLSEGLSQHPPEGYIADDSPLFARTAAYAATFNRIILFRGAMLHSAAVDPAHGFDASPRSGRLTANMFLHFWP